MPDPRKHHHGPGLIALAGAIVAAALLFVPETPARGEEDAPEYVGSQICAQCHAQQHDLWSGSSHAHTFEKAVEDNMPADVVAEDRVEHAPGSTRFRSRDGRFIAETTGVDGKPFPFALTHVVGRMRVRMFVTTLPDGRQQVLPAMLEAPTGKWFDYTHLLFGAGGTDWDKAPVVKPGEPSFWTGPVRSWDAKCARCHVSGFEPRRPGRGGKGRRHDLRALGVDCESCHGPGAAHVDHQEQKKGGADPIFRYADLAHERALGVCLQCHMTGEVVDPGFELGDDIFEFRDPSLLIDPEKVDPSGRPLELIYDGLPFSVSRCVKEGKLTCITCHDPHGSSHPSQLRQAPENDRLCTRCHDAIAQDLRGHTKHDPKGTGARCVSCHMPFLTIERGHGVVADHSISTPRFDLKGDRTARTACSWCHQGGLNAPEGAPKLEDDALREAHTRWWGEAAAAKPWMQALGAARLGEENAHRALLKVAQDRDLRRVVRASAAELLGRKTYAGKSPLALLALARDEDSLVRRRAVRGLGNLEGELVDAALLRALSDRSRAVRSAAARAALVGWKRVQQNEALLRAVLPVLAADAKDGPLDDWRWFRLGAARSIAKDEAGAYEAYVRMLELNPFAENIRKEVARLKEKLGR